MKKIIKTTRSSLGFELRRLTRLLPLRLQQSSGAGTIVEFVGLPGVGKTFLLKRCLRELSPAYVTQSDLVRSEHAKDFCDLSDPDLIDLYRHLLDLRMRGVLSDLEGNSDVRHQALRIGALSALLVGSMPVDQADRLNILADEGIAKNFTEALLKLAQSGHAGAVKALSRRVIVLLTADPDIAENGVWERSQYRKMHWQKHSLFSGLNRVERVEYYANMQGRYVEWIDQLLPYTRNVIKLSRNDDLDANVESVVACARQIC